MKRVGAICLLIVLLFSLTGCGIGEQEKQCLEDLKEGLQNRWDIVDAEYDTHEDYERGVVRGIEAELEMILPYKDVQFEDEGFDKIIKDYIASVENQKEGTTYVFSDAEKYNEYFYEKGFNIRSSCLAILKDRYNFTVDDAYTEAFADVLGGNTHTLLNPGQKATIETEYGDIRIGFTGFEMLVNPANERELVLYCDVENISYFDEKNANYIIADYFMGVYDGANYNIETKGEAYGYIPGYKECSSGLLELRQGEKGKFALIYDYIEDIDIIYVGCGGSNGTFGCYLTSEEWKENNAVFQNDSPSQVSKEVSLNTISVGHRHTVGLKEDGTVVAVGDYGDGQCYVSGWSDIISVEAGTYYTVGLKKNGTVVTAGGNYYGQCDVSDWTDIVAISAGFGHTVGLKSDGTVVATGWNDHGQCEVSKWTDLVSIVAEHKHTVGLKSNGSVVAVGDNAYGRCEVTGWTDIVAIAAGIRHTLGLKADGTVVATGDNGSGQCNVDSWSDIVAITAGEDYTVGLRADGTVVAVGDNYAGQCNVSAWTNVVAVAASASHTVGLKSDGSLLAVGLNDFGQCDVSSVNDIDTKTSSISITVTQSTTTSNPLAAVSVFEVAFERFNELLEDINDAITYYADNDFSTVEDIEDYEAMWQAMADEATAIHRIMMATTPPNEYKRAWDGFADCVNKIATTLAKGTDMNTNHDGKYTGEEVYDLLSEIVDEVTTVGYEACDFGEEIEKIYDNSTKTTTSKNGSSNSNSGSSSSSGKKCAECGKDAPESFKNPFSGVTEYYCQKHYNEIVDLLGEMEEDVGQSGYTPTCEQCSRAGTYEILGLSGKTEYYCYSHYQEIKEILDYLLNG